MPAAIPAFGQARNDKEHPPAPDAAWAVMLAAGVIVLATWAAYANSLSAPFVFDDLKSLTLNPSIRHLWPLGDVLSPPPGGGLSGRPLANLSFALNYAFGGESVRGYHAVNLALHMLAALVLFGVVRRTFLRPVWRDRFADAATPLAWAVALIWALHPLQTEAVTYVSQRTEVLMGLCYLLTLYGFIRGIESPAPARWFGLAIASCWLGAASKEVIVTAPLIVLLYDRSFVAGTFREAWRQRWRVYLGLASSWIVLAWLMRDLAARQVGFGLGVTGWSYALTECQAVTHYLWLAVWPHPLVFDYGTHLTRNAVTTASGAAVLALLFAVLGRTLSRWPTVGFFGAWVFIILAPTSSIVPVALQPMAEHRMYLPLAGMIVLAVLGLHALVGRWIVAAVLVLAGGLGILTAQRNESYRSEVALWADTVAKRPDNPRAQTSLGTALVQGRRLDEAREHFAAAVRLAPEDAIERYNLGNVLLELDRPAEALPECEAAVRLKPDLVEARVALGTALALLGRLDEAQARYEEALRLNPDDPLARINLDRLRAQRAGGLGR